MRYSSPLRGVGARLAYRHLVAPVCGIDEGDPRAREQSLQQLSSIGTGEVPFDELNIGQLAELVGDKPLLIPDLRLDVPSNCGSCTDEGGSLSACRVYCRNHFCRHYR